MTCFLPSHSVVGAISALFIIVIAAVFWDMTVCLCVCVCVVDLYLRGWDQRSILKTKSRFSLSVQHMRLRSHFQ